MRQGVPDRLVAERLNVPRGTVGWWRSEDRKARGETYEQSTDCPQCTGREFDEIAYAYLLGLYLGFRWVSDRQLDDPHRWWGAEAV